MILDELTNWNRYTPLHTNFKQAFTFLQRPDLLSLKIGHYEIDGEDIFAIIAKDQGRKKDEAQLEIHNKYIDIQFVLQGIDNMGWKARSACTEDAGAYDPNNDIQFYADQPTTWFSTRPNHFTIFFPDDAHLPLIGNDIIHKVVIKIAV